MPAVASNAQTFFEHIKIQSDPFAYLTSIPDSTAAHFPFFEEEWIDFKGEPQSEKDAKKIWSKALSGFANIADGLVVWGIDARKLPPRDIDAASGLRMITDPPAFESKLRDWIRDATNPPVVGVQFFSVSGAEGGFVVCLVPQSAHKPHRAEWADKHYFYRASDDFLMAEPGLLRTLFYPQFYPYLWVEVGLSFEIHPKDLSGQYRENPTVPGFNHLINQGKAALRYEARLHNDGTASAKDLYVVIQTDEDINVQPGIDWAVSTNPQGKAALRAHKPFHPGEVSVLFGAAFKELRPLNQISEQSWWLSPYFDRFSLRLLMYAEGIQRQTSSTSFVPQDFAEDHFSSMKRAQAESE